MEAIPPLPPYPPEKVRAKLTSSDWEVYLEAWITSIRYRLSLKEKAFSELSQDQLGITFLLSYLDTFNAVLSPAIRPGSVEEKYFHACYFLLKRILVVGRGVTETPGLALFDLLSMGSVAFGLFSDWKSTLKTIWATRQTQVKKAVELQKSSFIASDGSSPRDLLKLTALVRSLPEVAVVLIAGADYMDTLSILHRSNPTGATEHLFYCLCSLMSGRNKSASLLLDNLYHLKSEADAARKSSLNFSSLLSSLVCTTSFLRHLQADTALASSKRGQGLVDSLMDYKRTMHHLHPLATRPERNKSKGKQKASREEEMHVHKASQVSQVLELFPDLSSGSILKLLDHFSDDVEAAISGLLEPDSVIQGILKQSSHTADIPDGINFDSLSPKVTPPLPPQRRNVFDDDEFDRLQISSDQIHRKRQLTDVDQSLDASEHTRSKAAIMTALAAFDSDDDERDDTYDVADVGGAVDNTMDTDDRPGPRDHERLLFGAWKDNPEMFNRDSRTRISNARQQLKRETGMGDEQIEGWAIMLKKDPKGENRLQQKYSSAQAFSGSQRGLESTRWTASADTSEVESGNETPSDGKRMGQAGIKGVRSFSRGHNRGRGGGAVAGGASTSGPVDSASTQNARRRKEQGRGRGGPNHGRRDGRARKIGRGMSGPAT